MSGVELKTFNPVVFDDPDYCENEDIECSYDSMNMVDGKAWCILFGKYLDEDKRNSNNIKCHECKAHFKLISYNWEMVGDRRTRCQKQHKGIT